MIIFDEFIKLPCIGDGGGGETTNGASESNIRQQEGGGKLGEAERLKVER